MNLSLNVWLWISAFALNCNRKYCKYWWLRPSPPSNFNWPQTSVELTCTSWESQFLASFFLWITNRFKFPKDFFPLRVQRHGMERKILLGNNSERFFFSFWKSGSYSSHFPGPWGSQSYLWRLISLEIFNHKHLKISKSLFYFHQISIWKAKYVIICLRIYLLSPLCLLWIVSWQERNVQLSYT